MFVFCLKMVSKMCLDTPKVTEYDQKEICSKTCGPKEEAAGPSVCVCGQAFPRSLFERLTRQQTQPYVCTCARMYKYLWAT